MTNEILEIKVSEYGRLTDDDHSLEVTKWSDGMVRFALEEEIKRCQAKIIREKDQAKKNYWAEKIKVMELLLALSEKLG